MKSLFAISVFALGLTNGQRGPGSLESQEFREYWQNEADKYEQEGELTPENREKLATDPNAWNEYFTRLSGIWMH